MLLTLAISLFVLSIICHEYGHLVAMRRCGVVVKEFGIGLPLTPGIGFTIGKHTPHPLRLSLYPVLYGAFVKTADDAKIDMLPKGDRAFIYSAGIMANFMFTTAMLFVLFFMNMESSTLRFGSQAYPMVALLAGGTLMSIAFVAFPRQIALYVFPILSLFFLWWFAVLISRITPEQFVQSSGIVVVGQFAKTFSVTPSAAIYFAGLVSFALGAMNLLPIYLLDGGHLVGIYVERLGERILGVYKRFGILVVILLMIMAVGEDIRKIFFT